MDEPFVIIDLGVRTHKQIKQLRSGTGVLKQEVADAIAQLKTDQTIAGSATPVIVVVRERDEIASHVRLI